MNFDITFDRPPADDESPQEAWHRRVDGSILKLKDDVTPDDIAAEYPDVTDDVAEALVGDAIAAAFDKGDTDGVLPEDFPSVDDLDVDPDQDTTTKDDTDPSVPYHKQRATDDSDDQPETTPDTPTDPPSSHNADTDTTSDPDTAPTDTTEEHALEARVADLEDEVAALTNLTDALRRQNRHLSQVLVGEDSISVAVDADTASDLLTRTQNLDSRVTDVETKVAMVRTDGSGSADDPDGRARLIRQTLYNKASSHSEGLAELTRDAVDSRLGGGLHRESLMDAMKRAADGREAANPNADLGYSSISGTSQLEPVESVRFERGGRNDGQSKVVMELSDATGSEVRQNLTTVDGGDGG